jgi:hypothetical protein
MQRLIRNPWLLADFDCDRTGSIRGLTLQHTMIQTRDDAKVLHNNARRIAFGPTQRIITELQEYLWCFLRNRMTVVTYVMASSADGIGRGFRCSMKANRFWRFRLSRWQLQSDWPALKFQEDVRMRMSAEALMVALTSVSESERGWLKTPVLQMYVVSAPVCRRYWRALSLFSYIQWCYLIRG